MKISVRDQNFQENLSGSEQVFRKKWTGFENFVPGEVLRFHLGFHCIVHATVTRFTNRPFDTTIVQFCRPCEVTSGTVGPMEETIWMYESDIHPCVSDTSRRPSRLDWAYD